MAPFTTAALAEGSVAAPEHSPPPLEDGRYRPLLPGLAVAGLLAGAATAAGSAVPVVGAPVLAIVGGTSVSWLVRRSAPARAAALRPGGAVAATYLLQVSIVLLGTGLSLTQVQRIGRSSLPVLLGTLAVALVGAAVGGRRLGIAADTRTLIGVGTGVCGASAIAAASAVLGAAEAEVSYAIATIFTFNIAAVLVYPLLGHALGLSQHAFGLWAGTAVNDTSSVVAAATAYGASATAYGVVVKLTRSLSIIPICVGIALRARRRPDAIRGRLPWARVLPPFLVGFVLACALDTVGVVPSHWHHGLMVTSSFLITVALAGVGLSTDTAAVRAAGPRPLLLGGLLFVAVGATSLVLQYVTGAL